LYVAQVIFQVFVLLLVTAVKVFYHFLMSVSNVILLIDISAGKKDRLLKIFEGWCDNVIDLILATDEDAILRRDIYDREPILTWGRGRVTLLGDSVHAMQPNMGQGGCMAIEVYLNFSLFDPTCESGPMLSLVVFTFKYVNSAKDCITY
jgi:hypothetical protein